MIALFSQSVALSWRALNCLLCISTCVAAFCPSVIHDDIRLKSSDAVAFVGRTASWPRHESPPFSVAMGGAASPDDGGASANEGRRWKRARVRDLVRRRVSIASRRVQDIVAGGGGAPVAGVLADAAASAAELAAREVRSAASDALRAGAERVAADGAVPPTAGTSLADAFDAAEAALSVAEAGITLARAELENARREAEMGLAAIEWAAAEAAVGAVEAVFSESLKEVNDEDKAVNDGEKQIVMDEDQTEAENVASTEADVETNENIRDAITSSQQLHSDAKSNLGIGEEEVEEAEEETEEEILSDLSYDDVDYTSDMAAPFINEDECLVPGEPVVRVEKAPQNSRRIFAGIDIPVSVDQVWNLLTDYPNLQKVVPNLVVNEVLELYPGGGSGVVDDPALPAAERCRTLARGMKGAVLRQVGGAKVVGINFSARTRLEVREWPTGIPDCAHFGEEVFEGKSRSARVRESKGRELTRYVFPRPFSLSSLPHREISMQSVEDDDGEFRMYQGVWRMQPLPGCSPQGGSAMRLTYAVEVSPRPYLPVGLVERRIAQDLCANMKAIRDVFEAAE